jgi:transposase InsO family protein
MQFSSLRFSCHCQIALAALLSVTLHLIDKDTNFDYPLNGYRRLAYMMMDANVVACSPSTVHRVLSTEGLSARFSKPSKKGTELHQPIVAHEHWHIDVSNLNIRGTFYFCATILDGFSRSVVHWDIRPELKELDVEAILQFAKEQYPESLPRIISDHGPQSIVNDFKSFVRNKWDDTCEDESFLSSEQRQAGTLPQDAQERLHSSQNRIQYRRPPLPCHRRQARQAGLRYLRETPHRFPSNLSIRVLQSQNELGANPAMNHLDLCERCTTQSRNRFSDASPFAIWTCRRQICGLKTLFSLGVFPSRNIALEGNLFRV